MSPKTVLNTELLNLIESKLKDNLTGIEATLQTIFQVQDLSLENLRETIKALEKSFTLLSQKWNLQILYILFLRKNAGFGELRKILGINSRTLSDKLKILAGGEYISRTIDQGPPLRVRYALTGRGHNTILLALPFLYYSSSILTD